MARCRVRGAFRPPQVYRSASRKEQRLRNSSPDEGKGHGSSLIDHHLRDNCSSTHSFTRLLFLNTFFAFSYLRVTVTRCKYSLIHQSHVLNSSTTFAPLNTNSPENPPAKLEQIKHRITHPFLLPPPALRRRNRTLTYER